jgi:hypothetical protein
MKNLLLKPHSQTRSHLVRSQVLARAEYHSNEAVGKENQNKAEKERVWSTHGWFLISRQAKEFEAKSVPFGVRFVWAENGLGGGAQ